MGEPFCDDDDVLIPIRQVPRYLPNSARGKPFNEHTILRWVNHGVNGVYLEVLRIGAQIFTTEEALANFIMECTAKHAEGRSHDD